MTLPLLPSPRLPPIPPRAGFAGGGRWCGSLLALLVALVTLTAPPPALAAAAPQELRNASGKLLGTIREASATRWEARLANGRLVGTFDPKSNVTREANGRAFGKGNQLSALILREAK
jgi:hypothetical protein